MSWTAEKVIERLRKQLTTPLRSRRLSADAPDNEHELSIKHGINDVDREEHFNNFNKQLYRDLLAARYINK